MPYFRKRPIEIEAIRWTGDNADQLCTFAGDGPGGEPTFAVRRQVAQVWAREEGCWVDCPVGHWVVRGVLGEYYPVSPAAMEASYEMVGAVQEGDGPEGRRHGQAGLLPPEAGPGRGLSGPSR
ncbi:hypothetical protein [Peterkaempfera griseoplana]|uniref:hypothetical protein n=1 Tax=Peterkaempfera griseoplana TaxID=66896 RepID=UPI0006E4301C|nr:hypothetical protein [Peterkaempfera griseoplana]